MWRSSAWVAVGLLLGSASVGWAGGPRFVTGSTYNYQPAPPGAVMAFYTNTPRYFTDAGDLAANVSHAQADAMVAAAAAVWNVPQASLKLAQGGELAEHVSSANVSFGASGVVFPVDVQAANYQAVPIAVIYDTDGSVTDMLLGDGASAPTSCRQNAVTSSVDSLGPYTATINHAVMVLNGRCVGGNAQQMLQMQYQVMRAFGRVLGLAWSQCNDNVFTGLPTPTAAQMQHWPVMHPIDILCSTYSYQCMQSAFTLRPDDVAALALLYPTVSIYPNPGQAIGLTDGVYMRGYVYFPTGQGMEDVNMTVRRSPSTYQTQEMWEEVSAVTGATYQQNGGNAVTGGEPPRENVGQMSPEKEGAFDIGYIPVVQPWTGFFVTTQSINPLYTGVYAVGPYQRPPAAMSGAAQTFVISFGIPGYVDGAWFTMNGASACATGNDGTASAPAAADPSGWFLGSLCPTGHSSWWSTAVKANRSWTMEVTALDEGGHATASKLQPVLGAWNTADPAGTLPTVAAQGAAMNAAALGMTQMQVSAAASDASYRVVVGDQFGAGRPDFVYQARILYADNVQPVTLGIGGGQITVTGTGFRAGNQVLVNGVAARVIGWSATQIVADAPTLAASGAGTGPVDVAVVDTQTGGMTNIGSAVTYVSTAANGMVLVSAPPALTTGVVAAVPFAVRVVAWDGVAPVQGAVVSFAVSNGDAVLVPGGSRTTVTTDANGLAQVMLQGVAAGSVTVTATDVSSGAVVRVLLNDMDPVRTVSVTGPGGATAAYLAAGAGGQWMLSLAAAQSGVAAGGAPVTWSAGSGLTVTPVQGVSDAKGNATATASVVGLASGAGTSVTGCAWVTVCGSWTVYGVDASQWALNVVSGAGQSVAVGSALGAVQLLVTDGAGHPVQGATVTVHQTAYAWEGAPPGSGPGAAAPVLATAVTTGVSDGSGQVAVMPLLVKGQPQVVEMAASTGTQGFVSLALTVTP